MQSMLFLTLCWLMYVSLVVGQCYVCGPGSHAAIRLPGCILCKGKARGNLPFLYAFSAHGCCGVPQAICTGLKVQHPQQQANH